LFLQPLLAGGSLPGLSKLIQHKMHRYVGGGLIAALVIHLVGLWITSPPDVIDALLFMSATPFSNWGVIAMWSVLITGVLVGFRRKFGLSAAKWRLSHRCLAVVTVIGSVVHTLMIDGTMEFYSKVVLCACGVMALGMLLLKYSIQKRRST